MLRCLVFHSQNIFDYLQEVVQSLSPVLIQHFQRRLELSHLPKLTLAFYSSTASAAGRTAIGGRGG